MLQLLTKVSVFTQFSPCQHPRYPLPLSTMTAPPLTFVATPPSTLSNNFSSINCYTLRILLEFVFLLSFCFAFYKFYFLMQLPCLEFLNGRGVGVGEAWAAAWLHGGVGVVEWFANSGQTSFSFCIRVNESFTRVSLANAHFFTKGPIAN